MTDLILEKVVEGRVAWISERPIPFEAFLDLPNDRIIELVNGVVVEQMPALLDHARLYGWLLCILHGYVEQKRAGIVLGSRTAVEIGEFGGRLPDLLFVRQERMEIVRQRAVYGPPDLIVEIIGYNEQPSDVIARETDYRSIGVPEIWFLDQIRRRVRILHQREDSYEEAELTAGLLRSEAVPGFDLQVEWLFQEPRPDEFETLTALLARPPEV